MRLNLKASEAAIEPKAAHRKTSDGTFAVCCSMLRAIGPSLAENGITDPLYDPTLAVYDSNGTLLAFNDNWWSDGANEAGQITVSGFAPSNELESAIVVLLPAGNYTAIVRGSNGTTGVALFDAYQLP